MRKIRRDSLTIFFDIDGTLTYIIPERAIEKYIKFVRSLDSSISTSSAIEAYQYAYSKWREMQDALNKTSNRYRHLKLSSLCFERLGIKGDIDILADQLETFVESECDELYPEVREALKQLYENGFSLGILSDRSKLGIVASLQRHGIFSLFKTCISSTELDPIKGKLNDSIWEKIIEVTSANPSNILYVGDDYFIDVKPAQDHGITAILVDREERYTNIQDKCRVVKNLKELCNILYQQRLI